jgi:hypothetical protein
MNSKQLMQLREPKFGHKTSLTRETRHRGIGINRDHDHEISFPSHTPEGRQKSLIWSSLIRAYFPLVAACAEYEVLERNAI